MDKVGISIEYVYIDARVLICTHLRDRVADGEG